VNKTHTQKYGHLPPKIAISNPWEALCVDLIGTYTLKDLDGSAIDFMALTMINPTSCWFEIVEVLLVIQQSTKTVNGKAKVSEELIFDKLSC
jgi:hypothetical protein